MNVMKQLADAQKANGGTAYDEQQRRKQLSVHLRTLRAQCIVESRRSTYSITQIHQTQNRYHLAHLQIQTATPDPKHRHRIRLTLTLTTPEMKEMKKTQTRPQYRHHHS